MLTLRLRAFNKILKPINLRLLSTQVQNDIIYEKLSGRDTGIALYGLNKQKDRNALGYDLVKAMRSVHKQLKEETKVSVVIFHSLVPGIFCAGANLKERLKMTEEETIAFVTELRSLSTELASLPIATIAAIDGAAMGGGLELALCCDILVAADTTKLGLVETVPSNFAAISQPFIPEHSDDKVTSWLLLIPRSWGLLSTELASLPIATIAAIEGAARGGGLELALCCDILVAADTTKLGLVETSRGVIPGAGGTQRLPRLISPHLAKELILTAKVIDGKEAKALGIVNHSVPQNNSKNAAFEKALSIAREIIPNAPIALKCAKQSINEGLQLPIEEALKIEEKYVNKNVLTAKRDRKEGLVAFVEKRKPVYTGE